MSEPPFLIRSHRIRLDGWKAIAQHLGRSCRTIQRWHARYRMPVHHVGGTGGGVFVYSDELKEWFRQSAQRLGSEPANPVKAPIAQIPSITASGEESNSDHMVVPIASPPSRRANALVEEAYAMWRIVSRNNLGTIARLFREAIDLDRDNAEAYAGLSHALIAQGMMGNISLASAYSAARDSAGNALRIDPDSAEANCAQAWLKVTSERDWEGARAIFDALAKQQPVSPRAMIGLGLFHIAEGHPRCASEILFTAAQQDSLSNLAVGLHCWSEYLDGQYSEAMDHTAQARESGSCGPILGAVEALASIQMETRPESIERIESLVAEDSHNYVARGVLGFICGLSGNTARAQAILEHFDQRDSHAKYSADYAAALICLGLNRKHAAVSFLERSFRAGSLWSLGFASDPALSALADSREFNDLLRRADYPASEGPLQAARLPH